MSVTLSRQSLSSSACISPSGGMQYVGGGQSYVQRRSPSVYGGAGGYGTRISQSSSFFSSGGEVLQGDSALVISEKVTMQNLNDRLAAYMQKVRSLEAANAKLELQIREFYEKKTFISRDFTGYFTTINDLRAQIDRRHSENQRLILQIENAHLAAEDFRTKFEMEMNMRTLVEADMLRFRGVRDSLTLGISDLEILIEGLKEDLVFIKHSHREELQRLRVQQTGSVNVEVDSAPSVDLEKILEDLRDEYEAVVLKNKQEIEKWYQLKMDSLQTEIYTVSSETKSFILQLSELKRTYQSLEISRESVVSEIFCRRQNLEDIRGRYSLQLSQLQVSINMLEEELQQVKTAIEQQQTEYKLLLDIKMRLQMEIAEYRRLLDGELQEQKSVVVICKSEVHKEHVPVVERRVKTIVEEIIDGQVVSSKTDVQEFQ